MPSLCLTGRPINADSAPHSDRHPAPAASRGPVEAPRPAAGRPPRRRFAGWLAALGVAGWLLCPAQVPTAAAAERNASFNHALDSIQQETLQQHVDYLASDELEGREAGTRGGLAATDYVEQHLADAELEGGGEGGRFTQPFSPNFRNVLAVLEGSDPKLRERYVIVGAHLDHVGYGTRRNSRGPIGYIHNGADDNASGTAALLEVAEAFTELADPPRRSILFVAWDAEEKGLLGSKHWVAHPTVPLEHVVALLNMDMVGRLRNNRLTLMGTRSGYAFRRLASHCNSGLELDFSWKLVGNADHWPFVERRIPSITLHTGTHDVYHTPYDDADTLNPTGMQRVARFMFVLAYELAQRAEPIRFRAAAIHESPKLKQQIEKRSPRLVDRLGARWSDHDARGVRLVEVTPDSPADEAGLRRGDRVLQLAGRDIRRPDDLHAAVAAAENPAEVRFERPGESEPIEATLALRGRPLRLGVTWRLDDAEPDTIILTHVVPGSPAMRAGLHVADRVYEAAGKPLSDEAAFAELVRSADDSLELLIERNGQLEVVVVRLGEAAELQRAA
jgi:hypothetical protein